MGEDTGGNVGGNVGNVGNVVGGTGNIIGNVGMVRVSTLVPRVWE